MFICRYKHSTSILSPLNLKHLEINVQFREYLLVIQFLTFVIAFQMDIQHKYHMFKFPQTLTYPQKKSFEISFQC